jgi:hypothetical protein
LLMIVIFNILPNKVESFLVGINCCCGC